MIVIANELANFSLKNNFLRVRQSLSSCQALYQEAFSVITDFYLGGIEKPWWFCCKKEYPDRPRSED